MALILFEDEQTAELAPAALARPAMEISCGGYTLAELLGELRMPKRRIVRPHLKSLCTGDGGGGSDRAANGFDLILNARLVPSLGSLRKLRRWVSEGNLGVVRNGKTIVAALTTAKSVVSPATEEYSELQRQVDGSSLGDVDIDLPMFEFAHDIIRFHLDIFAENLEHRLADGGYHQADDGVFLAPGAQLGPYVTTDTTSGPIVLESGAAVESHSYLRGPIYLAAKARVVDHASIKSHVTVGHWSKLGGEVSCCVVEPYSNKAHHGFLGHSYLGSWINLGAGTTNSNLKNTYGTISIQCGERRVATGMQFLGCIIGDYTKTAINTSIFTGKSIGVCSMLYGFVTENVPSFVNYARQFSKCSEVSAEAATTMQARMFARRNLEPQDGDAALLEALHKMTAGERALFEKNLVAGPLAF